MTNQKPSRVSPRTEQALRAAMERLLTGRPTHTDGKLTKNNLWREAGVSRATMNRATAVTAEWEARISASPASQRDQEQTDAIAALRRQLRSSRHAQQRLREQLDAAATVIAALHAENIVLHETLASRSDVVVPLTPQLRPDRRR